MSPLARPLSHVTAAMRPTSVPQSVLSTTGAGKWRDDEANEDFGRFSELVR